MVKRCCVLDCKETKNKDNSGIKISYHKVPNLKQATLRKEWLRKIRRRDYFYKPSENIYVCSNHFQNKDFRINQANKQRLLKNDVVPTIFNWDFATESDSSDGSQSILTDTIIKKEIDTSLDDASDSAEYSNELRNLNEVTNDVQRNPTQPILLQWKCGSSQFEDDLSSARFQLENPGMDTNIFVSSDVIIPNSLTFSSIKKEPDDILEDDNQSYTISDAGARIKVEPENFSDYEDIKTEPETYSEDESKMCIEDEPEAIVNSAESFLNEISKPCIKKEPDMCNGNEQETIAKHIVNTCDSVDCSNVLRDEKSAAIKLKLNEENETLKKMVKELESQIALQKIKLLMKEVELSNLKKQLENEIALSEELEKQIEEQSVSKTNDIAL